MGINSTEVSYGFGQMGSVFSDGTGALTPPSGKVFVAITFLADTAFNSSNGLVADNDVTAGLEFIGTDTAAHDSVLSPDLGESGAGGTAIDNGNTFPKGVTIYGRWTKITNNASTPLIAYIGN
tara:strand:- start:1504 stop:1872 length:369 start_codon:yes stop_codon:yes gene_type:complete